MSDVTTNDAAPKDAPPQPGTMSAPRLAQFEDEVAKLKVTGGGANPERLGAQWGIGLIIVGFVIAGIAWASAQQADNFATIQRSIIMSVIGLGVVIVGVALWLRNSMTRYARYWIIRLVYEQREQTDAIVHTLKDK